MTTPALSVNTEAAPMLGAEVVAGGTRFRLFADRARVCQVRLVDDERCEKAVEKTVYDLQRLSGGYHENTVAGAGHGTLYQFVLDGEAFPDPYARFLPRGVHGPAMVVENKYAWRNGDGVSRPMCEQIIYELHVGTFTPEGTYPAARGRLQALQDLGVTSIELMPLSSFAGRRGWGYDGVAHFAPHPQYGTPDDLREFIDDAHGMGLSVLLDVVYNHFGPSGNYLRSFSPHYFSSEVKNAWGDGPNCAHPSMRGYVLANVRYWLTEFRFDGLRLDATHAITDPSPVHVLKEVAELAHALMPGKLVIAEDESNDPGIVVAKGMDGVWADDFHHVAHVILTGESDGYYASYHASYFGGAERLAETIRKGWLYEGQVYPTTGKPRGRPATALPAEAFVYCLQNHDQIGNRALGDRVTGGEAKANARTDAGYAALSTVLLFLPMTPLLFMGQEWAASSPFQFFTDHDQELGRLISEGRREEFKGFRAFADPASREPIPDPQAEETFTRSKLRWEEREQGSHARVLRLYKQLVKLRRSDTVLREPARERLEAAAQGGLLIVRRWTASMPGTAGQDRLLLANLTDQPIAAGIVAAHLGTRSLLLRSDLLDEHPGPLPSWTAVIAAGVTV